MGKLNEWKSRGEVWGAGITSQGSFLNPGPSRHIPNWDEAPGILFQPPQPHDSVTEHGAGNPTKSIRSAPNPPILSQEKHRELSFPYPCSLFPKLGHLFRRRGIHPDGPERLQPLRHRQLRLLSADLAGSALRTRSRGSSYPWIPSRQEFFRFQGRFPVPAVGSVGLGGNPGAGCGKWECC